jgi:hypothetical protein
MESGMSREEGIETVYAGGGHVVIIGAGASIASTLRNPEMNGKKLPSMNNLIEVVGLDDIVNALPEKFKFSNFEILYSELYQSKLYPAVISEIESRVYSYFAEMELPDEPTLYDFLVLSLRPKDLIASFNWDPFLFQAYERNRGIADLPYLAWLHGNTAIGFSHKDDRPGPVYHVTPTGNILEPTKLLYPVTQKDYNSDVFTRHEWDNVKEWLNFENTKRVTIFGYGAPSSDVEAVKMLNDAWGSGEERNMEQFEIIDIRPEKEVKKLWDKFINSHHYDYGTTYFDSVLAYYPRRTSESWFHHYEPRSPKEAFTHPNPIPQDFKTMQEMWLWFQPLIEAENKWKLSDEGKINSMKAK